MKSPFPGMDPYLEEHWGDVHSSLVLYARDALQPQLPDDLRSRVEERVYLESPETERRFVPDVHISEVHPWGGSAPADSEAGGVAVAEPLVIEVSSFEVTEGFVEIRERGGGKLITAIEFLSPGNKTAGPGQDKYREKQQEILRSDASLVEIDLLRAGAYVLAAERHLVPPAMLREPLACISPGWSHTRRELYTMPLRQRLSVLPIPLRYSERRVLLDMQALLEQAYRAGRYSDIDYAAPLPSPLDPEAAPWADTLLAQAGRRARR